MPTSISLGTDPTEPTDPLGLRNRSRLSALPVTRGTRIGGAMVGVGLVAIVAGFVWLFVFGPDSNRAPAYRAPGTFTRDLHHGRYDVYELTGHRHRVYRNTSSNGSDTSHYDWVTDSDRTPTLTPEAITVTDPAGRHVTLVASTCCRPLGREAALYTAALHFEAGTGGRYTFSSSRSVQFVVARGGAGETAKVAGAVLLIVGGFALAFAGGVLAVTFGALSYARRARVPTPVALLPTPTGAPPGWYPDPKLPGASHYWTGTRWADPPKE